MPRVSPKTAFGFTASIPENAAELGGGMGRGCNAQKRIDCIIGCQFVGIGKGDAFAQLQPIGTAILIDGTGLQKVTLQLTLVIDLHKPRAAVGPQNFVDPGIGRGFD